MKHTLAAALALLAAACAPAAPPADPMPSGSATAPAASAALNPVGTFNFRTVVGGGEVTGSLEVTGTEGAYGGRIRTSITPDIPITGVRVMGQEMIVTGNTPDGPLAINMTFTGNTFTGSWALSGDSGSLSGQRAP
jgi:hypothetical protein